MGVYTKEQNTWNFQLATVENFWNRVRNKEIESELNNFSISKTTTILEIGCGVGVVGKHLLEKDYNYWGCEPSDVPYILFDVNRFEKKYYHELSKDFRQKVKLIILADVIEHIEDDKKFLTEMFNVFPSLEITLITVPAYNLLWSQNDNLVGHFRRYTTKSLKNLIKDCSNATNNLRIVNQKNIFFTLSILMGINKIKNILMGTKEKLSVVKNGSKLDYLLEKISNLESKINVPFGSSIMIVIASD